MNNLSQALGLIEVIGYPTAIAAADAALKSAEVHLTTITKVGGGIMTVQLIGDVAAIRSAVDTGGEEAKRIGVLRSTHVIPRYDTQLMNGVIKEDKEQPKQSNSKELTEDDLRTRTNADLKNLINAMEIKTDEQFLKTAKKDELITTIMTNVPKKEEDNGING
ncbi:MAG: BMC domain-containing protein [Clostridia bacterium]|nr:BMC domain-containing protein [Clostridia bacterium]